MARISCQSQLILNTRRRYIATKGPFSRPRLFWDTPGQNIAIVRHPGTHNVNISPPPGAWECISRAYAAMPDRPMTHRGSISPAKPPFGCTRSSMLVPTVPRPSPSAGCGGGRRRDERAGTLARAVRWVRRRIDVRPTWGAGAIGCWLATRRSVVTARARDLLGRGRAAATRARIRTAALSAHQTRRSCCRYALRRDGAVSFARAVR